MLNLPSDIVKYKRLLKRFMEFTDKTTYGDDYEFATISLTSLSPSDVYRFLATQAYGVSNPVQGVHEPTACRASSLQYYKKALSYFMPRNKQPWDEITLVGNPTRSKLVQSLIDAVLKSELRGDGKDSQEKRALTHKEFILLIGALRTSDYEVSRYCISAYFIFQYHMIARIDDVSKMQNRMLKVHDCYSFALRTMVCHSKNIRTQKHARQQILLGAMDHRYCFLLALSIHLEQFHNPEEDIGRLGLLFNLYGDPDKTKKNVSNVLRKIFLGDEFENNEKGELGSHGIRKLASTHAANSGCSTDDIERRGRWKQGNKMVHRYIDNTLSYPDARVQVALCLDRPVKYVAKDGSGITDEFLLDYVVPNINKNFGKGVALTLGLPLLWTIMDEAMKSFLPKLLVSRVTTEYKKFMKLPGNENPVTKVQLVITGHGGSLRIDELCVPGVDNSDVGVGVGFNISVNDNAMVHAIYTKVQSLAATTDELKSSLEFKFGGVSHKMNCMTTTLNRISVQPFIRKGALSSINKHQDGITQSGITRSGDGAVVNTPENTSDNNADKNRPVPYAYTLSKTPKSIHSLWDEYEYGNGGRVAAKDFNSVQRGAVRFTFCRRKVVWDCVKAYINKGHTAVDACDKIYEIYGPSMSVTKIINKMMGEKRRGQMHQDLAY